MEAYGPRQRTASVLSMQRISVVYAARFLRGWGVNVGADCFSREELQGRKHSFLLSCEDAATMGVPTTPAKCLQALRVILLAFGFG